jgi:hypothetical protein
VHISSAVYENDIYEKNGSVVIHKSSLKNRGKIVGAYASLWKKGSNIPFTVYVEFEEYAKYKTDYKTGAKELMSTWKTMPATMICKVAESQVLRMAFQGLFGSTYDESEQWQKIEEEVPNKKEIDSTYENVEEVKETLDWNEKIKNSNTTKELLKVWSDMSKAEQAQMQELFTQRKIEIGNAATK